MPAALLMFFDVARDVMHQVSLLPLAVMLVLLRTSSFKPRQWLLATALAVSWLMDSTQAIMIAVGEPSAQIVTQYGMPVQVGLAFGAVVRDRDKLLVLLGGLVLLTFVSGVQGFTIGREIVVPVVGGFVVSLYAWSSRHEAFNQGAIVYFGIGAMFWIAWASNATEPSGRALATWYAYQGSRLAGIMVVTAAVIAHARRPSVKLV